MFAFLKRTFVVLLGLLLIFVVIWYAGPLFAFADYRPLETGIGAADCLRASSSAAGSSPGS